MKRSKRPLNVRIHRGEIIISIGIGTLGYAVEMDPSLSKYDEANEDYIHPKITKPLIFAREMVRALQAEDEEGSTMVHKMLDAAALEAIEQGAEGVELPDDKPLRNKQRRAP